VPEVASGPSAETPDVPASASQISDRAVDAADEPGVRSARDRAKGESEVTETTAAAWASWRRIRESGALNAASADLAQKEIEEASAPEDATAMAVAAGAEMHPEESSAATESDAEGIASIVDSVLADLRPKIFEEISRKMAKKKKK
jgi:hypothetical protein